MFHIRLNQLFFVTVVALSASPAFGNGNKNDKDVAVNISSALVPNSFDRGDVVTILKGYYPSSCYTWQRAEVQHVNNMTHEIVAVASKSNGPCATVLVPYTEEIHLGEFEAGRHILRYISGDDTYFERVIHIEPEE